MKIFLKELNMFFVSTKYNIFWHTSFYFETFKKISFNFLSLLISFFTLLVLNVKPIFHLRAIMLTLTTSHFLMTMTPSHIPPTLTWCFTD